MALTNGYTADSGTPHQVDPISRIEGHLGVRVQTDGTGKIIEADVHGNLWRGFENFLLGREPNDAITFTQRICGVCPVPHGTASNFAAESVLGLNDNFQTFVHGGSNTKGVPQRAVVARNLVLGQEFIMSHLTHFYHLVAPSYVQGPAIPPWTPYFNDADYSGLLLSNGRALPVNGASSIYSADLWSAVIKQYVKALRIRRLTFEAGALYAGRMPMTSTFVAGGVTLDKAEASETFYGKIEVFYNLTKEIGEFVIKEHVPLVMALGMLYPDFDNSSNTSPATATAGKNWGAGVGNFLSWGGFPQGETVGTLLFQRGWIKDAAGAGVLTTGITTADVETNLKESVARSHYNAQTDEFSADTKMQAYPGAVTRTEPDRTRGYSWIKAPRWAGDPMEVGPFARMVINGKYDVKGGAVMSATGWTNTTTPASYIKTVSGASTAVNGLVGGEPKLIHADLAVALLRDATLPTVDVAVLCFEANLNAYIGAAQDATLPYIVQRQLPTSWDTPIAAGTFTGFFPINIADVSDAVAGVAYGLDSAVVMGPIRDWLATLTGGLSTIDRLRARALEALWIVQTIAGDYDKATGWEAGTYTAATNTFSGGAAAAGWIGEMSTLQAADTWTTPTFDTAEHSGFGATEAPRGALMHQITINKGVITAYQAIVPTTWNASPKDDTVDLNAKRGPIEQAMMDVVFAGRTSKPGVVAGTDPDAVGGVEPLRVAQSFDPCIACAVH